MTNSLKNRIHSTQFIINQKAFHIERNSICCLEEKKRIKKVKKFVKFEIIN